MTGYGHHRTFHAGFSARVPLMVASFRSVCLANFFNSGFYIDGDPFFPFAMSLAATTLALSTRIAYLLRGSQAQSSSCNLGLRAVLQRHF
ncbi:hypothetical protein BDV37DRAFT_89544 [Aspergillus pseudonomiae]|uniref:Uncharacterized protein n=1 Tax=Aspergillus pseudonomiae TaxID=1506151 RepID=A0A5N7DGJ6_9EURO|nr:uncharacterized protein BDV37DRAFT_89544 [Aspergillus pseudonomiae]KAE8405552.1 hypothetical protein BDV37DRAFT_89544 [Aspergillus pseudonomiae]